MAAKLQTLLLLSSLFLLVSSQISANSSSASSSISLPKVLPCAAYQNAVCISCPYNYHKNQNQCYLNITSCLQYDINVTGQEECTRCDNTIAQKDGMGGCSNIRTNSLTTAGSNQALTAEQAAKNYGDLRFRIITLEQSFSNPYFTICNNYMLNGQYKHFIARSSQPVVSVAFFSVSTQNQYKILYNGSGGGLMMCIITIETTTNKIQINSFVTIGITNIIDNCGLYDTALTCLQCVSGWHLEGSLCYRNIQGCDNYSQNICLSCVGFAILVENRCITCTGMGDLNKVVFYRDVNNWLGTQNTPTIRYDYLVN